MTYGAQFIMKMEHQINTEWQFDNGEISVLFSEKDLAIVLTNIKIVDAIVFFVFVSLPIYENIRYNEKL